MSYERSVNNILSGSTFQSYSIYCAVSRACSLPKSLATTYKDISIPADMPADTMILPLSMIRLFAWIVVWGATSFNSSMAPWWVVAARPSSKPAFARSRDPVHTERINSAFCEEFLIQSIRIELWISFRVPNPPGTSRISGWGQSWMVKCGLTLKWFRAKMGCPFSATV